MRFFTEIFNVKIKLRYEMSARFRIKILIIFGLKLNF